MQTKHAISVFSFFEKILNKLEMWANVKQDGRPAEYRWRPLFNTAVWLDAHY